MQASDSIPASEAFPEIRTNPSGVALRGARVREGVSQRELSRITGIPQRHISEMESGKRAIGKVLAHKLGETLRIDYRLFL